MVSSGNTNKKTPVVRGNSLFLSEDPPHGRCSAAICRHYNTTALSSKEGHCDFVIVRWFVIPVFIDSVRLPTPAIPM